MSDEEYERFEITDYDLDNEFNPNRNRRRPTKNQAIYGIWADNSGDSDDSGPELGGRRKKGFKDYSKPLNFVAGGVQQAGKKPPSLVPNQIKGKKDDESGDEDDGEEEREQATSESEQEEMTMNHMAGFRTRNFRPSNMPKGMGDWEAHTKGIGSKLLQKMGYEPGKGLGKELQGINAPVQAFLRKGRGAIGAYGPEKAARIADQKQVGKKKLDDDEKEALEFKEKMSQWKGKGNDKKRKVRYVYRTVEEVIAKGQKSSYGILDQKMSKVTVIDMTGPEKRVLSGYHALGQAKHEDDIERKETQNFALPELMHNLNLLVDMSEQEIIAHDRRQRAAETRIAELEQEKENLHKIVELEKDYLTTLESALELVEKIVKPTDDLTLEDAEKVFIQLKVNYPTEYKEFQLQDLVPGVIAPLVNASLRHWEPFENPTEPISLIKKWMSLLDIKPHDSKDIFDPYSVLIWSGIIPRIRAASANWNPRQPHEMASLLDAWAPLLPEWILDNILDQMVLAKLTFSVNDWNPLTDHVPIHTWIHPWVQLLGTKMQTTVYPVIRDKLSKALKAWSPEDRSARLMINPWKGVFAADDMEVFLAKNIVPKLELRLRELQINPLQQEIEIFNQVWEWHEILSLQVMVHLFDRNFFPNWMQILVVWLNQNPNFNEVSRWYQGWKSQFNDAFLQHPQVKDHFRRALELMSRACGVTAPDTDNVPTPPPAPIIGDSLPSLMDIRVGAPPQLEFKEIVSQRCAERGIIFAPMPGRRENGKQVYRVGKLFCYIDRSVCVVSQDGGNQWNPMSVQQMMEIA
ncbi:septin-interacting protein 1-like [Culicoides brevitarsis]|uniref:septin-interacting protein 1-like n=1 Tax=Culicoides brevitarsis TaxID=469753 RepID=UPI00307C1B4F